MWLGDSLFIPKCVSASKNTNTTHGTLLVLKLCMKIIIYPSSFRDFDGRNLVVRTINISVDLQVFGYKNEPFVFSNDVEQVFYVPDLAKNN
jgi:hypothetical protein